MSVIARLQILWMSAAIQVDRPERMRSPDIENHHFLELGELHQLAPIGRHELSCAARGMAPRVGLELVVVPVRKYRLRPWLKRRLVVRQLAAAGSPGTGLFTWSPA